MWHYYKRLNSTTKVTSYYRVGPDGGVEWWCISDYEWIAQRFAWDDWYKTNSKEIDPEEFADACLIDG